MVATVVGIGSACGLFLCWSLHEKSALATVGGSFALVLLLLSSGVNKSDAAYSAKKLAQALQSQDHKTIVAEYTDHLHGLPYYLDRRIVQISYPRETLFEQNEDYKKFLFATPEEFLKSLHPSQKAIVIMRDSDYEQATIFHGYLRTKIGGWNIIETRGRPAVENKLFNNYLHDSTEVPVIGLMISQ